MSLALENETKERITTLQQEVLALQDRSIQYNILKREVDTNRELYGSLLQRYKEVDVASGVGTNNIFVVDAAQTAGGAVVAQLDAFTEICILPWSRCRLRPGAIAREAGRQGTLA